MPPTPLVSLAGWLVPGAGYFLIGHHKRALVIGACVVLLFTLGILIAGIAVVEAPSLSGSGTMVGGIGSFTTNTRILTPGSMYPYAPILFD